jgi:anti-sigma factor RsiW
VTTECVTPIADETLVDYWSGGLPPGEAEAIEEHLFGCAACTGRLEAVAALAAGVASLARRGRFAGIISRATLNQLQRDGVRVRVYSVVPGDVVPCAVFPDDDLVVTSMRGDFSGVDAVTLSVAGSAPLSGAVLDDVPVSAGEGELLWATPGALIRQMPTSRVTLTVTAAGASGRRIGEYVLDHTAETRNAEGGTRN